MYRDRLRSCFGIVRDRDGAGVIAPAPDFRLSQLADQVRRAPQLLICATVNVPHGRGRRRRAFSPFVMTEDTCGVPGTDASFSTSQLELGRTWARPDEPLVSLFTAVAATGAAIAPSMGRLTLASARPFVAALNFRLGCWLPNPFNSRSRAAVAGKSTPGRFDTYAPMGPGYNELIPEMLGMSGPRGYVSDGGHYDNLGLIALLRARCAEIWCIDSSPEPDGAAEELIRVLALAESELGVTADIDPRPFNASSDGLFSATSVSGTVTYAPGVTARLIVVKLGLTAASPARLRDRRKVDRKFPHHSTVWHPWFERPRMEAYRDLGDHSTTTAVNALRPEV